jgi:hypothetical protein
MPTLQNLEINMRKLLIIPFILPLAACETPEQSFARLLPAAEKRCVDFGFKEGTEAHANCLQREVSQLEDREAAAAAALADGMDAFSEGYNATRPTTCYTTGFGFSSTTTCY